MRKKFSKLYLIGYILGTCFVPRTYALPTDHEMMVRRAEKLEQDELDQARKLAIEKAKIEVLGRLQMLNAPQINQEVSTSVSNHLRTKNKVEVNT